MITFDIFLVGLMVVSAFTGVVTEGVKKILSEFNVTYYANTLAGIVATVLSIGIGTGYIILSGGIFDGKTIVCLAALAALGWLVSMVGYDKVVQVITQLKTNRKG